MYQGLRFEALQSLTNFKRKLTTENPDRTDFKDKEKNLVQVDEFKDWEWIPKNLRLTITDGSMEMRTDDKIFIKYEDSSIKKDDLKYLMVSGGSQAWTDYLPSSGKSWEMKDAAGTWNIKAKKGKT